MPLVCFSKRWGRTQAGGRPVHGREVRPVPLFRAAKLPPTFFDEGFRVRSNVDPASIFEPFSSYALRTLAIRDWRPHCFGLAFSGRLWRDWPIVLPAHH
jgi:hypothetical protein